MTLLLLLVLALPNPQRVQTIVDERVAVGSGRIRHLEINLPDTNSKLECHFKIIQGDGSVRIVVVDRDVWPELRLRRRTPLLAATPYEREGTLIFQPKFDGTYVVAIDNRAPDARSVVTELSVRVVRPNGAQADPARAQIVVWSGVGLFLALFCWSSYRIRKAIEHRAHDEDRYYYF